MSILAANISPMGVSWCSEPILNVLMYYCKCTPKCCQTGLIVHTLLRVSFGFQLWYHPSITPKVHSPSESWSWWLNYYDIQQCTLWLVRINKRTHDNTVVPFHVPQKNYIIFLNVENFKKLRSLLVENFKNNCLLM
jgi:hypothetical protein